MLYRYEEEETKFSPHIILDGMEGFLSFKGKFIPENPKKIFTPVFQWLESYMIAPPGETKAEFFLTYLNSSSSKHVISLINKLKILKESGKDVEIIWYYDEDDDAMMEIGQDYAELLEVEIHIKAVQ